VLAPRLVGFLPGLHGPAVVVEIVAGIIVGPSALGWVGIDPPVQILALLGLGPVHD
jgi:Kef-type K+ transport system membrane component KefB